MMSAQQTRIYEKAVSAMGAMAGHPLLYGPDNKPLAPSAVYSYSKQAAARKGSLKNWIPKRLLSRQAESMEREAIVARAVDLVGSDPHAAGVVDGFAIPVVGAGLMPHPAVDAAVLGIEKEVARKIEAQMRSNYLMWSPFADAGRRLSFGAMQHLAMRCVVQYGEYFVLLPMLKDDTRPFSLACQIIHPLRVKTPVDLTSQSNIRDGVELGAYGEPVAYWIKKADPDGATYWSDNSNNFMRVEARQGHRHKVLHGFICNDPEQVRGMSFFAPAMKFFRDLNDYLDAELVSNIVTAAFSLFIETGNDMDALWQAQQLAGLTETYTSLGGDEKTARYQEIIPGQVMYGAAGQKPYPISANRPGTTFEPFTKIIKKAISMSFGIPYPVMFKDVDGVSYAGFRSAMLDAWRVFTHRRSWLAQGLCHPVYTMLQEEAWLRDRIEVDDFYRDMWSLTHADWRGAPKGDIEPIKAVKADILAMDNDLKTMATAVAEHGGSDLASHLDQREEEKKMVKDRNLGPDLPDPNLPVKEPGGKNNAGE